MDRRVTTIQQQLKDTYLNSTMHTCECLFLCLQEIQIEIRMKISNSFRCGWQHRASFILLLIKSFNCQSIYLFSPLPLPTPILFHPDIRLAWAASMIQVEFHFKCSWSVVGFASGPAPSYRQSSIVFDIWPKEIHVFLFFVANSRHHVAVPVQHNYSHLLFKTARTSRFFLDYTKNIAVNRHWFLPWQELY